ncbi:MAG TPA: FAD-dependent oxidoreductase [Vicinamibacterales bacterium]|nr:FAD-dependent oxidoreductase [Vicinamibacterales bacterium]
MARPRRILVIGGGPAGVLAATSAKARDPSAAVTLLSDEAAEPYEKPPLSKAVLLGRARPEDAPIAGPRGLAAHGVEWLAGARCTAVDRPAREVVLADGRRLAYDALVLATGAVPRPLPQLPPGTPRVCYLRTAEDACALRAALTGCRRLLVVGGGLIGLEVAAAAAELGIATTVLEVAPRILARVCDEETAAAIHAEHARRGVDIRPGTTLVDAAPAPSGCTVVTGDGDRLAVDLVVVGTGIRPNDALAAAAGLATADGVVVDERCRTSDPAVLAAGDVARFPGPDGLVRLENWKHALDQGAVAGRNAAGADEVYAAVPSFWSEQYDLYIQGVGWSSDGTRRVGREIGPRARIVFTLSGDRLVSAMGINAQRDIAAARRLIERRVPVDPAALVDPARPLAALLQR